MNRKQFFILLAVVVVLGLAGIKLYQRDRGSWRGGSPSLGKKLFADLPVNDVASITLKSGSNEVVVARVDNLWRVQQRGNYPANFTEISDFLVKAGDLKIVQTEDVGPSQLWRFGMLPPGPGSNTATLVEFKDATGKPINSLLLGKQHMRKAAKPSPMEEMGGGEQGWPDGRYVVAGGAGKPVALISEALSNLEANPAKWLNMDFFKIEKPRTIAVTFPSATNSWKLVRANENTEWVLADTTTNEVLDVSKVSGLSNPFSSPSFVDALSADTKETTGLKQPSVVTVETFDHLTYKVNIGAKTNENQFLALTIAADLPKERTPGKDEKPEDKTKLDKDFADAQKKIQEKLAKEKAYEKWIYLVPTWTVDAVLKERSQILMEKKSETSTNAPAADLTPPPGLAAPDKP
jgi:hypothetical protein